MRRSSSSRAMPAAISSGRSGLTSTPASPSTSGSDPRLAATTGTPAVIASSTGMPKPSSNDGMHQQPCAVVERPAVRRVRRSRCAERDPSSGGRAMRSSHGAASSVALPARTSSRGRARPTGKQLFVGIQQAADVFPRFERAEKQHVAVARRRRARRPAGRARRADRDPIRAGRQAAARPRLR